jgi:hypothetical protein
MSHESDILKQNAIKKFVRFICGVPFIGWNLHSNRFKAPNINKADYNEQVTRPFIIKFFKLM